MSVLDGAGDRLVRPELLRKEARLSCTHMPLSILGPALPKRNKKGPVYDREGDSESRDS